MRQSLTGILQIAPMVACSTQHLTVVELERINAAFGMEPHGPTYRVTEDIRHDGLYMSPKDCGFFVRIPRGETLECILPGLTPEMRSIVNAAVQQNAARIEFDVDVDTSAGLPVFDHGN